jgi:type I restriction enzyme S subunit
MAVDNMITNHIDVWTSTIKTRSSTGRGISKNFDLYGIKKLHELILGLAVHGELVRLEPSDEPVSELLKRIAGTKKILIQEGVIKKKRSCRELPKMKSH